MSHNTKVLLLGAACMVLALGIRCFSNLASGTLMLAFTCVWLSILSINLWYGTAKAGYSLAEELRVGLFDFSLVALPTLAILWLTRHS